MILSDFVRYSLSTGHEIYSGVLPEDLVWTADQFREAWNLHPETKPTIFLHGREVTIPRWQQAFGAEYHFSGQVSKAAAIPPLFAPLLEWTRAAVHPAMNGLLLNWYDGPGHYIGPHRDSVVNMIEAAPIMTISFGEARKFRLSLGREKHDLLATNGSVIVIPQPTNAVWKHSVPKSTRYAGRRISVTVRAFRSPE